MLGCFTLDDRWLPTNELHSVDKHLEMQEQTEEAWGATCNIHHQMCGVVLCQPSPVENNAEGHWSASTVFVKTIQQWNSRSGTRPWSIQLEIKDVGTTKYSGVYAYFNDPACIVEAQNDLLLELLHTKWVKFPLGQHATRVLPEFTAMS